VKDGLKRAQLSTEIYVTNQRERERKTQSVLALGSGRESGGGERERDRKGEVKKEREIIIEKRGEETPSFKKFWKKVFEFFAQVVP
jgi:hypothetical protein